MTASLAPGEVFGGYRIESVIGRGGMGVVYRAYDVSLDRPVALKLVAPELADDEGFRRRFLREPRLAAALDHPNVIPIYEAGERDDRLYLAMRYVEGRDLRTELAEHGALALDRALRILAPIGDALDAAHRRGLAHRDVKPANILIDAGGHAYLTDFGVSKHFGGDTTDTGELVGTLDYLAPEQIRGEPVDGRSDQYALACVLYECLGGAPPFRRSTQAETMWAHLHDDPPPLLPALDPVLHKGLAKEPDERYDSCGDLIAEAAAPRRAPPRVTRHPRALMAVGAALLLAAVTAALAIVRGGGDQVPQIHSGVAAIAPGGRSFSAFVPAATAPSNIAVGEGAVWALNSEDTTVTRIDPRTHAVKRFEASSMPSAVAAGGGALWIGTASTKQDGNAMVRVSRIDPATLRVTHTQKLPNPNGGEGRFSWGIRQLVAGDGGVWAIDPDNGVSRLDERTGRVLATIGVDARTLTVAPDGVWTVMGDRLARIDPATNRVNKRISLPMTETGEIAAGAGSLWVAVENPGVVLRVGPGRTLVPINVGRGVRYIAYGAGAVWVANFLDQTVSRIDPRTNRVTARIAVGTPMAITAGATGPWVSTDGTTPHGAFPASSCGGLEAAGRTPDVLIASDFPLQGINNATGRAMADAIRLVLRQHDFRAGRFNVGYRPCDEATAQTGNFDQRRCSANANAYANVKSLVALIGPWSSYCAAVQLRTLNQAPGGPVPVISSTTSDAALTRPAADAEVEEPGVFYPTGVRNFMRVATNDDQDGLALAVLAKKKLGLRSVYIVQEGSGSWKDMWQADVTLPFTRAANRLGLTIAGMSTYDPLAKSYAGVARAVARSGADGVVIAGWSEQGGDRLAAALSARLGSRVALMSGFGFDPPDPKTPAGMYVATIDVPRSALPMTPAGARFARDSGARNVPLDYVLETAQAAKLVLAAIAHSDGTRASVLGRLRASRVKNDILGSFGFDRNGDIDPQTVPILREAGRIGPHDAIKGAVFDRFVEVPAGLS